MTSETLPRSDTYVSATKNLVTEEVEVCFHVPGSDRRVSISLTPDEARALAKRIAEAAEGHFSITIADLDLHNTRIV